MDRIVIKGELKPDFKLKSVRIKGEEARITDNSFETEDIQLREGMNSMLIELTDVNGRRRLVSYALVYEPRPQGPGGGSPILTLDMTAEGYTAPAQKKLSTRTIRRTASVSAPAAQTSPNLDVVFSSPYANQVITEDKIKIGGRFNKDAGIGSITVNGQACTLDPSSGTFEGPMLISPGEARRKKINSDSTEYIIMRVNPENHSGKNELKVVIRPTEGKAYEDRVAYWYYKMFVMTHVSGNDVYNLEDGFQMSTPRQTIQSYNKDLLEKPPFGSWPYPEKGYRYDIPLNRPGLYYYNDDSVPYYFTESYPTLYYYTSLDTYMGHGYIKTYITLHSPPLDKKPFVIVLKNCSFLEDLPFFPRYTISSISGYKVNDVELKQLGPEPRTSYVVLDNVNPDTDFGVSVDTPYYAGGFRIYSGYIDRHFAAEFHEGLTGDILVDSNNDGFLGGEDNAVEQNEPGCVFWVNNDDDYDESPVHPDDKGAANSSGNDSSDDSINGIRDLEDFLPFDLTIPHINEWGNTQNVKFYLRAEGEGEIRVFKRVGDNDEEGTDTYLMDLDKSIQQYQEKMKFIIPFDNDTEKMGQLLDPLWFDSDGKFYGIFEGVKEGMLKLILEVELGEDDNKKRVVLDEVYLTLKNVRDMYRFVNVREGPTVSNTDNKLRYRKINVEKSNMFMLDPSSIYIFMHGASTPESDALTWSNTVYKRLYRTGYRGGFIGFSWDTKERLDIILPKLIFDNQWVRSFQTGQVLADVIENTKNEYEDAKINLMAHSLGGNLASYALRLLAVQGSKKIVDNVFLIQTAVTGNAFATEPHVDYYKDMYVHSIANNITGKAYNLYYVPDILIDLFYKDLIGVWWTDLFLGEPGLPVPLDDNYTLLPANYMKDITDVDYYRHEKSKSGGIGNKYLTSKLSNFMSETYFNENNRPFGIRDHLSFGTEYYYDVKEYFEGLINPVNIEKRR